ncbi:DUF4440 domain-containing protein [Planococcus sp. CPCC 101016]|uniref:nuclear transport factor 2 family protein n=1 Tax=Planococcus sp. CPCC 101016 TaxID=2599617 RepID=UPI0011B6DC1E|nr:DUF4440 domain-containing protein [Planococcus sp. CPCC 101016]TWT04412.1 DUF4440 domain-containing protein [Planococcus sp. CPCC 101016]
MDKLTEEMYELECSHLHPEVRVSAEKLGDVLDDEFFEFGSSGGVIKRSHYSEDDTLSPDPMEIKFFSLHELGPAARLTTYQLINQKTGRVTNRSSVWKKRQNGWKLFFHQGTVSTDEVFQ